MKVGNETIIICLMLSLISFNTDGLRNQSKLEPKKESVQRGLKGRGLVCDLISKCFVLFSFGLLS